MEAELLQRNENDVLPGVLRAIRATARNPLPDSIEPEHSFVMDLRFDSMSIAILSVALEDEFDCSILLDGWIGGHRDPSTMTVRSLCRYLEGVLDGRSA
ncbi:MAG: phosphopantetheine-binding protein [Myxococcota bacterium]